jgi:hypothetical protein
MGEKAGQPEVIRLFQETPEDPKKEAETEDKREERLGRKKQVIEGIGKQIGEFLDFLDLGDCDPNRFLKKVYDTGLMYSLSELNQIENLFIKFQERLTSPEILEKLDNPEYKFLSSNLKHVLGNGAAMFGKLVENMVKRKVLLVKEQESVISEINELFSGTKGSGTEGRERKTALLKKIFGADYDHLVSREKLDDVLSGAVIKLEKDIQTYDNKDKLAEALAKENKDLTSRFKENWDSMVCYLDLLINDKEAMLSEVSSDEGQLSSRYADFYFDRDDKPQEKRYPQEELQKINHLLFFHRLEGWRSNFSGIIEKRGSLGSPIVADNFEEEFSKINGEEFLDKDKIFNAFFGSKEVSAERIAA